MKKSLLILLMLAPLFALSQAITVNTSSYTVPELVNNVLINSPCVSATNVTWRTGTNFSSSNGIGFFQNSNPEFPMQGGVILSTGSALNAPGPNSAIMSDGSVAWTGDTDLEQTLAAAGITMVSANATVLEFDFTPISSQFNFDFVFASEEYGNFQCQFSDAFAFLLTNVSTGVTTNLAVVPNTNTPISVVTIRDFLYNSSCNSQNPQYFGSYNGGSQAAGSATNFNGETVLLNATSTLVPNTPYHIKLVIADRSDNQSDSAIFISSNSFNIGQDVLGLDLTVANSTAICFGETYNLSTGLNPASYSFSWTKDGAAITGANGPSISVTQPGSYSVTYTNILNTCQPVTDTINIEYHPQFVTPNPVPLYKCDTSASIYNFDLSYNTPIIMTGLDPATQVSYHASQSDADNNTSALPLSYPSVGGQTIYVRIKNANSPCYVVKSFTLNITPAGFAAQPEDMEMCARSLTLNNAFFPLSQQTVPVLNGHSSSIYSVTYYTSAANAGSSINPITAAIFVSAGQTIWVRMQNMTDPSCFSIVSFELIINPLPPIDTLEDIVVCDFYILPSLTNGSYFTGINGTGVQMFPGDMIGETMTIYIYNQPGGPDACFSASDFKVTVIDPMTLSPNSGTYCSSYTLPPLEYGEYHTAAGGAGDIIPAGSVITASQTVHVYFVTITEPFCVIDTNFDVTILQAPSVGSFSDVFDCMSYTLPPLTVGNYYTAPNGTGTEIPAGTVITATQTVYVHAQSTTTPPCTEDKQFTVFIGYTPPADITQCEPYTLPVLPIGNYYTGPNGTGTEIAAGTVISTPMMVYIYIPNVNTPNCMADVHFTITTSQPLVDTIQNVSVCNSFTLPALTNGAYYTQTGGTGAMMNAGDVILNDMTVYIYATFSSTCTNESSFTITINPLPEIDSRSDIDACNSYVLTDLTVGNYYTGPNGTGTMLPAGTIISTTQTIYIYAISNSTPPCPAENSFDIYIFSIEADTPPNVIACDSYTLPPLAIGDYYANSGGPVANTSMMHAGDVITSTTTLYIYVESGERINCIDENSFNITINATPVVLPVTDKNACGSYTLPAITTGNYYTGPGGTGTMLNAGDVITATQTLYVYAQTGTMPNCSDEKSFNVNIFNVDQLSDVTTCENFILPALASGQYYTGPNGTGTILSAGTSITASTTIYIYGASAFAPSCSDETSFTLTIIDTPVALGIPAALTRMCDEDGTNDGIALFDLTILNTVILGNQTSSEFSIAYYETLDNATAGINAVTSTLLPLVYARVSNSLVPNCFAIRQVNIVVNRLPEPNPIGGFVCIDSETESLLNSYTIASGLSASQHSFQWKDEAGTIVGTGSTYTAVLPGTYTVTATNYATGCTSLPVPVVVGTSEPAIIAYTVDEDFANSQSITVIATGVGGDYEYQLDSGDFQDSNVFSNVSSGIHTITVRDKNGCGVTTTEALVINYPHFFTPNGDGHNDTWNIKDLNDQFEAEITIFDRYGKFLTKIKPSEGGWNGSYNGQIMPSSDYWFVVNYEKDGAMTEFRAHFAMKK